MADGLAGTVPPLPPLGTAHGYLVRSLPSAALDALAARHPELRRFVRQRYRRSYARLDRGFDAMLAGMSAKSRSTLRRKLRRFADQVGGTLDVRCYRTPDALETFYHHARAVSALTYQERLLSAGLPEGADALAGMRRLAEADDVRAWLLFLHDKPVAYLYAPADGETLIYAYLGYDPAVAELSPGTVLQAEAMRMLMAEGRFRLFDFTEGEGQHKRLFGSDGIDCVDLLLLRPTIANLATAAALRTFDGGVEIAKAALRSLGLTGAVAGLRR